MRQRIGNGGEIAVAIIALCRRFTHTVGKSGDEQKRIPAEAGGLSVFIRNRVHGAGIIGIIPECSVRIGCPG